MSAKLSTTDVTTTDREVVVSRVVDAPRERVYRAWTVPEHVARWWGPDGFTNTVHEMDVRPGGVWRLTMHGPDGVDYPNRIIYSEVVPEERLVYQHDSGIDNDPDRFDVVVTFHDQGGKTEVTLKCVFQTTAALEKVVREHGALEGARQNLERMDAYVSKM